MTGEELYDLTCITPTMKSRGFRPWADQNTETAVYYNELAQIIDDYVSGLVLAPHKPSSLPVVIPVPKDPTWAQFFVKDPGFNVDKVIELINLGYSKLRVLSNFANLDPAKLDEIWNSVHS